MTVLDALIPAEQFNQTSAWFTLPLGTHVLPPGTVEQSPWQQPEGPTVSWPRTPNYVTQCDNYSFIRYARDADNLLCWGVTNNPTPGNANPIGYEGITEEPSAVGDTRMLKTSGTDLTARLAMGRTGDTIYYTLNGAWPSLWSDHYRIEDETSLLNIPVSGKTTILRAFSTRPGWLPSAVVTHTYIFPQSILGTYTAQNAMVTPAQQKPPAWPDATEVSANPTQLDGPRYRIKYAFDQGTASNSTLRQNCLNALDDIPIVAISGNVEDLFDQTAGGIYASSDSLYKNSDANSFNDVMDPRGLDWKRPVSFEYIPPIGASVQKLADLTISGTASLLSNGNAKYGFRVDFRKDCRSGKLEYPATGNARLFPGAAPAGSSRKKFGDLVLRALSQDGYSNYTLTSGTFGPLEATNLREDYGMSALCNAGTVSGQPCSASNPLNDLGKAVHHRRRVHLFLNGLYWGCYALCERVDEDFMQEYFGGSAADWQVWNNDDIYNPVTQPQQWRTLLANCRNVARLEHGLPVEAGSTQFTSAADAYAWVNARMDLAGYIDYILTNVYLGNFDWPANNFRFAWNRATDRYVFLPWDMERSLDWFTSTNYSPSAEVTAQISLPEARSRIFLGGAAEPFLALREYAAFRTLISQRLTAHFDTAGAFFHIPAGGTSAAKTGWTNQMNVFSPLLELESGRWSLAGTWLGRTAADATVRERSFYSPINNGAVSNYEKTNAFQRSEPGFRSSNTQFGDWNRATGWIQDNWFTAARITDTKTALMPLNSTSPPAYVTRVPAPAITRFNNTAYVWYQGGEMFYTDDGSDPATSNTAIMFSLRDNFQRFRSLVITGTKTYRAKTRALGFLWSNDTTATFTAQ